MTVQVRTALAVGMLVLGLSGTASAQKDAGGGAPAWPSRIVFGPPVRCSGAASIEDLVNAFNTFGQWDTFTGTMTALLGAPCGTRPAPSKDLPYVVMIVQKGTVYAFVLPQGEPYVNALRGAATVHVALFFDAAEELNLSIPSDFRILSTETPNPVAAQIPDLAKQILAAQFGGLPPFVRVLGEQVPPPPPPSHAVVLLATINSVDLPFRNATLSLVGTMKDGNDKDVKVAASYVNRTKTHVDLTLAVGALVGGLKGAEKMKVEKDVYASNPLARAITMAAVAYHPVAYESGRRMSFGERFSILGGGVITPAPGIGGAVSFGIIKGLAANVGSAWMWVPTGKDGAKPGDAAPAGSNQLEYKWSRGWFLGANYLFK